MSKKIPEISIFFPFWNEGRNIEQVIRSAIPVAERIAEKWEILMINDGSSDDTGDIAEKLAQKNKNMRLISHFPNRGYGAAIAEGFSHAKYNIIVFNDGDGQFDFSEVSRLLDAITDADMVIGYRKKRNDTNLSKRLLLMN